MRACDHARMRNHSTTTSTTVTSDLVATELSAAADLLRAAAPLPPMMVMYAPRQSWRLMLAPEEAVAASRQQVAVKRLAARMSADVVRRSGSPPWAHAAWGGVGVFVSAQPTSADHVGHGATAEQADLVETLAPWVYEMTQAGAEEIWVHQPHDQGVNPDHRLRVSVHATSEVAEHLVTLDDSFGQRPGTGAWAGSALTPTGHDVVIVRT